MMGQTLYHEPRPNLDIRWFRMRGKRAPIIIEIIMAINCFSMRRDSSTCFEATTPSNALGTASPISLMWPTHRVVR